MEEANFKELFQRIVDRYELAPDVAAELLQRILIILKSSEDEALQVYRHTFSASGRNVPV